MPAVNDFVYGPTLEGPATHAVAVTPNDTTDLAHVSRALWVGTAGNVEVDMLGGETSVVFKVPAGGRLDVMVTRVRAALTTASDIVSIW